MAIITKPAVSRGTRAAFTLNKSDLLTNPVVSGDGYFSSSSVWNTVSLHYKSTVREQFEDVLFQAQEVTPVSYFFVSQYSQGNFEIDYIAITDFDGGKLIIPRGSLTALDFDITL